MEGVLQRPVIPGMDKHTIATQLVCAWLSRTEVNNMGSGETAARETGDYIAWGEGGKFTARRADSKFRLV